MNGDTTSVALCHCQRASKVISPFIILMLQNEWVEMEEGWPLKKSWPLLAPPPVHKKLAPPLVIIIVSYQQVIDT